mmetsp:Transcript_8788/g.26414  ORF Transcript_8788/g.26414 Transcript_8788/m.26414 type:complete len:109 (+) Transcript_8788:312-638(+)
MAFVNSTIQARSSVTKRSAAVCLAKGFGKPANDNSSDQPQRKARKAKKGSTQCSTCRGTGKFLCPVCDGTGEMIGFTQTMLVKCVPCDGAGMFPRPCKDCEGVGFFTN